MDLSFSKAIDLLFEKYKKEIAYPFGHGLSYSKFKYENFNLVNNNPKDSILYFSVDLTNISNVGGKEVAQLYVGFENSEIDRPLKLLRDFKKVYLNADEKKVINFKVNKNDLSYYNTEKNKWMNEKKKWKMKNEKNEKNGKKWKK